MPTPNKEEAKERLLSALPHFRHAASLAKRDGKMMLGILSVNDDRTGKVISRFEADTFFDDLAAILDAPPQSEEDEMEAKAEALLQQFGLK